MPERTRQQLTKRPEPAALTSVWRTPEPAPALDVPVQQPVDTLTRHDFSRISVHAQAPAILQPKLTVNTPGDVYEQEADQVAEQVMRMEAPLAGETVVSGLVGHHLQAQSGGGAPPAVAPETESEISALHGSGQALDQSTRAFMEPRFGHDFSQVRIHATTQAATVARSINALAFTVGNDIAFGAGQYQPQSSTGRQLLAHELAHVVQQGGGSTPLVQRQDPPSEGGAEESTTGELTNDRFSGNAHLQAIAHGGPALTRSAPRPAVQAVQQALLDVGYSLLRFQRDGRFGSETSDAIRQFRTDQQIPGDELDSVALLVLDRVAPPAGAANEHFVDYDRLLADNRLTIAVAVGFDEGGAHTGKAETLRAWLSGHGFSATNTSRPGIEQYTATQNITYPTAQGAQRTRAIEIQFTMVTPGVGASGAFLQALNQAEVTVYTGHARGGLGPDFDDKHDSAEQVNIGADSALHNQRGSGVTTPRDPYWRGIARERTNDFEQMAQRGEWNTEQYRVWFFNGCTTLNYMDEIRGGLLPADITRQNLDVFGTRESVPTASGVHTSLILIEGILQAQTMEQIVQLMQQRAEADMIAGGFSDREIRDFRDAYFREGAGDNPVAQPAP